MHDEQPKLHIEALENKVITIEDVEKQILHHYLAKGYVVDEGDWGFEVQLKSYYKHKEFQVRFSENNEPKKVFSCIGKDIQTVLGKAKEYFSK